MCFLILCCQSNTIINTAILTNQPVSLPVIVLAISRDGKVSDVTSAVTCHSINENTVKVQHSSTQKISQEILTPVSGLYMEKGHQSD